MFAEARKLFYLLLISAVLAGCAHLSSEHERQVMRFQSWHERQIALRKVDNWEIDGAFSVQENGQVTMASYTWIQRGSWYQMRIHSALNLFSVLVVGKPGAVTLWRSQDKYETAYTPEELMRSQLGISMPVSNLFYWVRGLSTKSSAHRFAYNAQYDRYGHLLSINQDGWHVEFSGYHPVGPVDLPGILKLRQGKLQIKIVEKNWKISR